MSWRQAAVVGLFQAVAIVPGISRSGSTIAGGLLAGLARNAAAAFSFFIAIPAIFGAVVLVAKDIWEGQGSAAALDVLAVGAAVSFVVGCVSLRCLLQVIARGKLHWFAYYCAAAAVATIAWQCVVRFGGMAPR
jgi:undecaprenyl-diphosphatase